MPRLSKRTVDGLEPRETDFFVWDSDLPGFGIRVLPSGRKSYLIQYRDSGRRTRRKALGRHGTVTAEEAKAEARQQLSAVARGSNPAEEKKRKRTSPSIAELGERFMSEYVPVHCKASTAREYQRSFDLFINPAFGNLKAEDITRSHVAELHHKIRDKPYQANRTLGVLSVMFNQAEIWGNRPDGSNPCRHVKKYSEEKRERYLSTDELKRLGKTLDELAASGDESLPALHAIRLLILTGCRLGEIQTLKWDYVHENALHLPDSKTGKKKVPIGQEVHLALENIERIDGNPYVITGKLPGNHISDMQKPWRRIRSAAGLEDLRIHDLRHSFASNAVGLGESLPMIGKLLGHSQVQTTARYAHLADDPVTASVNRISGAIGKMLNGEHPD